MPEVKPDIETFAKIKVVGVGGSGGSAVNRMVAAKIRGVEFIVMNTDVQALHYSNASTKLHIGKSVTRGLGAGMDPDQGRRAAEESQNEIRDVLKGADMVFVTCGLGGGTGSGAAPIVAEVARENGALVVGVVTKPFAFEGAQRRDIAEKAHDLLQDRVDAIITVPNDRVLQIIDKKTTLIESFRIVDDVLRQGVQGISELITVPGLINVDFADVKAILKDSGSALMGIGRGTGENRAMEAAKAAIASPLLEVSIDGARGILFIVTGGTNIGMHEVAEAAKIVTGSSDSNAKVIFGTVIDENMKEEVKITVVATGFGEGKSAMAGRGAGSYIPTTLLSKMREAEYSRPSVSAPAPESSNGGGSSASLNGNGPAKKVEAKKPASSPFSAPKAEPAKTPEEEDLEIPAFIRKKMI